MGQQLIMSGKRKTIEHQQFITAQAYIPINIGSVIGGGKINFPPTIIQYNHGLFNNISLGAMVGYSSTTSKEISLTNLLSAGNQLICDNTPDLAASLGIDCSVKNGSVTYTTNYLLLGASAKYFIEAGEHIDVYGNVGIGYKAGSQKKKTSITNIPIVDDVAKAYNEASKVFVITSIGTHIYLTKEKTFALTAEGGYSYGLGDDIVIGTKSIVFGIGLTYHISPQ
jgi:hypothetical protein